MSKTQEDQSSNKNPSGAFKERVFFDQLQRKSPDTWMSGLDPDPPVLLALRLRKFDRPIMTLLNKILPAGQSKGPSGRPLPLPSKGVPKAARLAKRVARGDPSLTQQDIDVLAARIGWLIRNWFRRDARDGYEKCLQGRAPCSKKSGARATTTPTSPSQACAKGTNLPQPAAPQIALPQPLAQAANPSLSIPSIGENEGPFQKAGGDQNPVQPKLFGTQDQRVSSAANLVEISLADDDDFTFGVRSMGGPNLSIQPDPIAADRAEWQREIEEVRAAGVPLDPPRLKTFAKEFPIPKAKTFFLAVCLAKGSFERAIVVGKELAADHDALSATIAVNKSAKDDVINWFAFLGIDLC